MIENGGGRKSEEKYRGVPELKKEVKAFKDKHAEYRAL